MWCATAVGRRSTTVCASTIGDAYSALRRTVALPSATTTAARATLAATRRQRSWPRTRAARASPAITASTASAISGRYIRRSAPTSVAIGMMLEVGASVMKNHAPR